MPRARSLSAFALAVVVLGACNSPDKVKSTTKVCLSPEELAFRVPKNATLAPGVDYAEMVRQKLELDQDKPEKAYAVKLYGAYTLGTKCKSAMNEPKCMQALTSVPDRKQGAWQGALAGGSDDALMIRATRGDAVQTLVIADDAKTLFLPVDTPEEAAMIALGRATPQLPFERTVGCDGPNVELRGDGSWVVSAEATRCEAGGTTKLQQKVRVTPDGKVTVMEEKKVGTTPGPCDGPAPRPSGDGGAKEKKP